MTNKTMFSVERDSIAIDALKAARQFIANGIELGFISMPEPETPDPAHDTLPMIDRAIAELKAAQHQGEPVALQHIAVSEGGVLRWMTGRKMQDCELYAMPDGSAIRSKLFAEPPAPVAVVMPERKSKADYSGYIEQFQSEAAGLYNSALDDVARLNVVKS